MMKKEESKMSREEIRHIAEALVDELRECEDGYITTTGRLAAALGYSEEKLGVMEKIDLHEALLRAAKANHITLDISSHDGKIEGLPFNLEFVVHNKKAQIKCPHCGSKNTAKYILNCQFKSEEVQRKLDAGKWILRDSSSAENMPQRHCLSCNKDFCKPATFMNRTRKEYENYIDEVIGLHFYIGGFFQGHSNIEIKRTNKGAHVHVNVLSYSYSYESYSTDKDITTGKWYKILNQLYNHMYLHEWKKNYDNNEIFDGEQWSLKVSLTGGRERNYYGSNDYPPYWKELEAIFTPYLKNRRKL